jgi:hypothetical protein
VPGRDAPELGIGRRSAPPRLVERQRRRRGERPPQRHALGGEIVRQRHCLGQRRLQPRRRRCAEAARGIVGHRLGAPKPLGRGRPSRQHIEETPGVTAIGPRRRGPQHHRPRSHQRERVDQLVAQEAGVGSRGVDLPLFHARLSMARRVEITTPHGQQIAPHQHPLRSQRAQGCGRMVAVRDMDRFGERQPHAHIVALLRRCRARPRPRAT